MSHIPIRNSDDEDTGTIIYFPVSSDKMLTLEDLRSAFPRATSLRYKDTDADKQHHILCRENIFVEPDGGWHVLNRIYLAINSDAPNASRFGVFESYRKQLASKTTSKSSKGPTSKERNQATESTTISVGHGYFKNGVFCKINSLSLSGIGGVVTVGPFSKTQNTACEIKKAAFEKFTLQNRNFRQKYKSSDLFYLVYPDGSLVRNIPGSGEEFSLLKYRNSVDPQKRFERLRLYLCTKSEYESNADVEIVTDSSTSSDELPPIVITSSSSNLNNESLQLTVKIVFHHKGDTFADSFPNNATIESLMKYAETKLGEGRLEIKLTTDDRILTSRDRLMELSDANEIHVDVHHIRQDSDDEANKDGPIRANYQAADDCKISTCLVKGALEGTTAEPVDILRRYQAAFLQGRPLDVNEESVVIDGETTSIFISRLNLFEDAMEEIKSAENIRFPLEVNFHAENAEDFGGPRKEFFSLILDQFRERLLDSSEGRVILRRHPEALARNHYYFCGIFIGLSAIEGGPVATFVDSVLENTPNCEEKMQLVKGLERTGIMQLIQMTNTVKYLFRPTATTDVNVSRLLHLFEVAFSEEGSSRRILEENTYTQFVKYVREVYGGRRGDYLTLDNILAFATGSRGIPLLGFSMRPAIRFVEGGNIPTATTCINCLFLPLGELNFDMLDLAFVNTHFGLN